VFKNKTLENITFLSDVTGDWENVTLKGVIKFNNPPEGTIDTDTHENSFKSKAYVQRTKSKVPPLTIIDAQERLIKCKKYTGRGKESFIFSY
jgi:hypothetical protein